MSQPNVQAQNSEFDGIPQCVANSMFGREACVAEQVSLLDAERLAKGVIKVQSAIVSRYILLD